MQKKENSVNTEIITMNKYIIEFYMLISSISIILLLWPSKVIFTSRATISKSVFVIIMAMLCFLQQTIDIVSTSASELSQVPCINYTLSYNYVFSFLCPAEQDKHLPISHSAVFVQIVPNFNPWPNTNGPISFRINMFDIFELSC